MKRAVRDPIVVAIVAFGIVVSVATMLLIRQQQLDTATRWLDQRAEVVSRATAETIDNTLHDLNAIAAFLGSTPNLTQAQFADFVDQLNLNPGVFGVGYVAIVEGSKIDGFMAAARADVPGYELLRFDGLGGVTPDDTLRPMYYPLRFVHGGPLLDLVITETPIDSQIDTLGFDLASEPVWNPAFEQAIALRTPSVSELLPVGGVFEEKAFGAAHPIFGEDGSLEGMLVAPGLETLLTTDLGVSITENIEWSVDNGSGTTGGSAWPVWTTQLDLPGSTWTVAVQPTESARADLFPGTEWLALSIGLGITLVLATMARQMRLRRREHATMKQLRQMAADKDRFLAAVSHELRTPLTVTLGLARELAERPQSFSDEERTSLLEMIGEHSEEASAIVDDLLVAARSDISKVTTQPEAVDLGEVAQWVIDSTALPPVELAGAPGVAHADPSRVRQIMRNLLTNAARYGGPQITVTFRSSATQVMCAVTDNGPAIPTEERQRIFEPYTSAHDGGLHMGSIGLGLYISRELALLMDGDLTYSHDGRHSRFELTLPRRTTVAAEVTV